MPTNERVFNPYPWQIAPFRDVSPVLLLTGSKQGGKSHLAAEKINGYLQKYPGATATLYRKAHEFAVKSIVPMMQYVIGDERVARYVNGMFQYTNGSRAYVAGMLDERQRQAARSLRGLYGEPDIAWFEEANASTRSDLEEIIANTRGKVGGWQQVILTTNPDMPQHHIYTDLILGGGAKVYYSGLKDNPNATRADFERLDRLTGVQRDRLRDGKWVRAEGVVYDEFDADIHLIDRFEIPVSWNRYRTIDFGYTNPFVCQWWAIDPDSRMYLYREIHEHRKLVEDLTPAIIKLTGKEEYITASISDHDAEDRATMARHGIATIAANKEVLRGIQLVKGRLKKQGDGKPRMMILRGSLVDLQGVPRDEVTGGEDGPISLQGEMGAYLWAKFSDGKPNKEEPVKMFDHHQDPARYLVMHLDGGAGWLAM